MPAAELKLTAEGHGLVLTLDRIFPGTKIHLTPLDEHELYKWLTERQRERATHSLAIQVRIS